MQIKIYIGIIILFFISPMFLYATGEDVKVLVIDPGHGGKATGAVGLFSMEKDIALKVSLKFGALVKKNLPDVRVIYTRTDDRAVDLRQRGKIANQNKADLFISIHCNAVENRSVKGVETFAMGVHKNETNLKVAQLENSDILIEQNHAENYDDFDPNSPDAYIIFSMHQTAFSDKSLGFAAKIQDQYIRSFKSPNRGVKQAGFLVLWACAMPSVLTEIGFISNAEEEKFLNSEAGQNKIALSLFTAFREYKYDVEGFNNQMEEVGSADIVETTLPSIGTTTSPVSSKTPATPAQSIPSKAVDISNNTEVRAESAPPTVPIPNSSLKNNLIFKVQFASTSANKDVKSAEFKNLETVSKYHINGIYKYSSGEKFSMAEAQILLKKVKNLGYKDAFIVAFKAGTQINITEAMRILQGNK